MHLTRKVAVVISVAALSAAFAGGCTSLDHWERRAIFQNEAAARSDERLMPAGATEIELAVPGGGVTGHDVVHTWYLAAQRANAPTVLYLHGARHSLYGNAARIERLQELGFNVLALDYRGFGRSTPILPSEQSAIEDAKLAYAEMARREPDPARRFVYGYSLGGAMAIAVAHDLHTMAGVVVESSFTSITDLVRTMRWGWLPFLRMAVTQKFDSETRIRAVSTPLLFLHGTADGVVPHTMSDRLFAAAAQVPEPYKRIIKIDGASHRGALAMPEVDYGEALRQFVLLAGMRIAPAAASPGAAAVQAGAGAAVTALH